MLSRQRIACLLTFSLLGVLGIFSCTPPNEPFVYRTGQDGTISSLAGPVGPKRQKENDPTAPEFYWHTATGALDSLSGQQGKVVLLNFWATWCGPCKAEMPSFQAISKQYSTDS